jgi:hypothetical protein
MSISKGAFGQSGKGGFIESRLGARGWGNPFTLIVGGTDSGGGNNLFRLDPTDGSVIWGAGFGDNTTFIRNVKHGPTGRLFINAATGITATNYEINPDTGAVITSSVLCRPHTLDVDANGKIYIRRNSDNDVIRVGDDLTTSEINCNASAPFGASVDSNGNIFISNSSSGSTVAERFDNTGTLTGTSSSNGESYSMYSPAGDFFYLISLTSGPSDTLVSKVSKSTLNVIASTFIGATGITSQPQCWATDGSNIYITRSGFAFGEDTFTVKIRISDMTEVARFTQSTASPISTASGGVSKNGNLYVTCGGRTNEWDGSGGSFASVWAIDSSMSLVWAADIASTFSGTSISGSFTKR